MSVSFDFLGAQAPNRARSQVLDYARGGSGWLIAIVASLALVGVFFGYQIKTIHDKDVFIQQLTADRDEIRADIEKQAAQRQGVRPDLAAIAEPVERMRDSGKTLADKVSAVAKLRPDHLWLDEINPGSIVGGAIDDTAVAKFVRSLHTKLGMPVSQGQRTAKQMRRTYVWFTLKVGQ